ncbi:hypothetical protein HDU76_013777 [Blyttiomyces sp. JEL0837]|nr:hypothetical protein HDU76_013777 [Blyttiomyces sp. JEL0837]
MDMNTARNTASPSLGLSRSASPSPIAKTDDLFSGLVSFPGTSAKVSALSLEDQRKKDQSQKFGSPSSQPNIIRPLAAQQRTGSPTPLNFSSGANSYNAPLNLSKAPVVNHPAVVSSGISTGIGATGKAGHFEDLVKSAMPAGASRHSQTPVPMKSQPPVANVAPPVPVSAPPADASPWDLDFFEKPANSAPITILATSVSRNDDPFDLGVLSQSLPATTIKPPEQLQDDPFAIFERAPVTKSSQEAFVGTAISSNVESNSEAQSENVQVLNDFAVAKIIDMGFDVEAATIALEASNGDLDLAIEFLVRNREASQERREMSAPPVKPMRSPTRDEPRKTEALDDTAAQLITTASALGKSVLSNAKTVFDFSRRTINQVYDKASGTISSITENISGSGSVPGPKSKYNSHVYMEDDGWRRNEGGSGSGGYEPFSDSDFDKHPNRTAKDDTNPSIIPASVSSDYGSSNPTSPPQIAAPVPVHTATEDQIQVSHSHKVRGNELFKIGQYGAAEECYAAAVRAMPSEDWRIIPVLNNRAAARLKTGDYSGVIEDCNQVQSMNSKDSKSLLRRATAYEALEKWKEALVDYESLMHLEPTSTVTQAISRLKKAIEKPKEEESIGDSFFDMKPSTPRATPSARPPPASVRKAVDKAVESLRQQNLRTEQEENEKFEVKEQGDLLIEKWRAGKENNIRALLSSLNSILWKDSGWVNINLSELITPQQVKVKYMKAVAKVHPDKLKAGTTVEQRMIANGVFATLNKAWDNFREANGL